MNGQSRTRSVRPTDTQLRYAAAALAYAVAALHLFHPTHGFGRLVLVLSVDPGLLLADPRPLAFVLSGLALVVGVPAAGGEGGPSRKLAVALGIGLMATYLVGYFAWHLSGHGGFLPGRKALYHGLSPTAAVVAHMSEDPWAAASVVAELALGAVLVALYRRSW